MSFYFHNFKPIFMFVKLCTNSVKTREDHIQILQNVSFTYLFYKILSKDVKLSII